MRDLNELMQGARQAFSACAQRCTSCGACTERCELLTARDWDLRALCAESLACLEGAQDLAGLRRGFAEHADLYRFARTCLGCDRCTARCPEGLSMSELRARWRNIVRAGGYLTDDEAAGLFVDCTWNIFSAFRAVQGISYADMPLLQVEPTDAEPSVRHDADARGQAATLFFPGCTLCSYAPNLTRAAFAWLEENEGPCLLATQCCASTLEGIGEGERAMAWKRRVVEAAITQGVTRIVTVCPGCQLRLSPVAAEIAPGMEFVPLARLLADAGVRVTPSALEGCALPVSVVDSCQNRAGDHGSAIRRLFQDVASVPFPAAGKDAWCCGASGSVNTIDPRFVRGCTRNQLKRAVQAGAGTLITACPTCAYTYAFERHTSAAEGDSSWDAIGSLNYLEALFEQRIDWPAVFSALEDMWTGAHAPWALARLFPR